jgi:ribosomal protein L37AE/L43A
MKIKEFVEKNKEEKKIKCPMCDKMFVPRNNAKEDVCKECLDKLTKKAARF